MKMNNLKRRFIILSHIIIFFTISCSEANRTINLSKQLLGTTVTITVISDQTAGPRAVHAAFDEISRIEKIFSIYKSESQLSIVNSKAHIKPVKVDSEVLDLIKLSIDISKKTDGAFDITFASMGNLWNYRNDEFIPPSSVEVKKILPAFGYKNILIDEDNKTVMFLNPLTKIGFGGIAKGYAAKRAVAVLKDFGIKDGIVACAGDIQVFGDNKGKPWLAGIKHPREDSIIGTINLYGDESISTSGDYERFKFYKGKRFHHIINPKTGYPSESGLISATVICSDPVYSDACATAIFVMGLKDCCDFLKREKFLSVILIDEDLTIYVSNSLKDRVSLKDGFKVVFI
ncbi:MAG: FAD:protein FMN transferase [Spirochaetes bacterium]|nr:FAD:protein FMN transferase [Spirochaetota bacterium]